MKATLIRPLLGVLLSMTVLTMGATDPTMTSYSASECQGSLMPYPTPGAAITYPDSLVPVYINHVGRHGARFPASATNCRQLAAALSKADSLGTITPLGRKLMAINSLVISQSEGRWGALDSLGMAEQRAIASRMFRNFRPVFAKGLTVSAISSYSPRVMMSMFSFTHQLDRLDNSLTFLTSTGRINSPLMRPFDTDADYLDFRRENITGPVYDKYFADICPTGAITRVLGRDFPFENADQWRDLAITQYYVLAGCSAMSLTVDMEAFFTSEELNRLWSCFNLRQYLQRTASTVSPVPADIASYLVLDLISSTDEFIEGNAKGLCASLRFGHAETLMPLLSLLRLDGCYYLTNYFDTVASHWRDFEVVPMAANLQIILLRTRTSGRYYVMAFHNERPVSLLPGQQPGPQPWGTVRDHMMSLVPLYTQ